MHAVTVIAAALIAAIVVLVAIDRVALWMERRGWIYWRKRQPGVARGAGGGGLSGVLTDFQQLVEPQVRHVIEDREERRVVRLNHSADGADAKRRGPDAKRLGAGD